MKYTWAHVLRQIVEINLDIRDCQNPEEKLRESVSYLWLMTSHR